MTMRAIEPRAILVRISLHDALCRWSMICGYMMYAQQSNREPRSTPRGFARPDAMVVQSAHHAASIEESLGSLDHWSVTPIRMRLSFQQRNVEYLYFQLYTHTTQGFTPMNDTTVGGSRIVRFGGSQFTLLFSRCYVTLLKIIFNNFLLNETQQMNHYSWF